MTQPPGYPGRPPYGDYPYEDDPYSRSGGYGHADPRGADDPYGQPSSDWFGRPSQPPPHDPYRDHGYRDQGGPGDHGAPGNYGGPGDHGPPQMPGQPGPRHGIPSQPSPGQPPPGQPYPRQPYPDQPYPDQPYPDQPYPGQSGRDDFAGQDFPTTEFTFPPAGGTPDRGPQAHYQPSHQQPPHERHQHYEPYQHHEPYEHQQRYQHHEPPVGPHHTPARSRGGLIFAVVGGLLVLALLGIGGFMLLGAGSGGDDAGAGTTTSAAGAETANPATVADSWLTAMFIDKSAEDMLKHTCKKESDRKEIDDAIKQVKKAEQDADDAGLSFTISWSDPMEVSKTTDKATVETTLRVKVGDKTEKKNTSLDLVYEAGWKVCDAQMS